MVRINNNGSPSVLFWNCAGLAILVLSVGASWSLSQAKAFELELAQYKLTTGGAIADVQAVSDQIRQTTKILPKQKAEQIKQQLDKSNAVLDEVQQEINGESND
jgi:hypothetical protein